MVEVCETADARGLDSGGRDQSLGRPARKPCITPTEEAWAMQAATERREARFNRRIDIIARKALIRVMANASDPDVARAALEWIKFRAKPGKTTKDKSADIKQEKVEQAIPGVLDELVAKLEK